MRGAGAATAIPPHGPVPPHRSTKALPPLTPPVLLVVAPALSPVPARAMLRPLSVAKHAHSMDRQCHMSLFPPPKSPGHARKQYSPKAGVAFRARGQCREKEGTNYPSLSLVCIFRSFKHAKQDIQEPKATQITTGKEMKGPNTSFIPFTIREEGAFGL